MKREDIISMVKSEPKSTIAENKDYLMEGVVVRHEHGLRMRGGNPLIWKLKVRDFK